MMKSFHAYPAWIKPVWGVLKYVSDQDEDKKTSSMLKLEASWLCI